MSTDAAMPVDGGGGAPAPAPATDSGEMTAAERAYFQSRGEDVAGLMGEAKPAAPAPVEQPKADAKAAPAPTAPAAEEDGEPGEIEISADGKARDTQTGRFVPKSAYLRVRDAEKTARQEASRYRDLAIAAKERLALYAEATGDLPKQQANEPPSPEEDIFGFAKHVAKELADLKSARQTETTERALQSAFVADARAFAAKEPSFTEAYGFLATQFDAELQAMGYDQPQVREKVIQQRAREIITQAMQSGRSGAATLYNLAKARGWSPKPAVDPAAEAAKASAAAELQKITDAQKSNPTLRGAGTGAAPDALTPAKIADMGDAEYSRTRDAYIAKHGRQAWNALVFGG